jgi:hypothetical protein
MDSLSKDLEAKPFLEFSSKDLEYLEFGNFIGNAVTWTL